MSIKVNAFAEKAYDVFRKAGMTKAGACGLMGNIYSESAGFLANRVEFLCIKRIKEYWGETYTDETYTEAVNSGKITRERFLNPLPGKQYGYGAIQWTTPSRKAGLYDRTVAVGKSIADEDAQLDYIIYELENKYQSVMTVLKTTGSVKEASDKVLKDFESPANWQSLSATRAGYGQNYYDYFKDGESEVTKVTKTEAINKLIEVAEGEIGYLEKKSNSQLDDKTANAGYGNYTKYWRDVYPAYQGLAYCACFVSWCFMKAFGLDKAKKLLKHWPYVYCPTMANLFKLNANPKVGDIVIFYRNGVFAHTGIVIGVNGDQFTTIEGNTSNGSSIVPNGGAVCQKSYYNSQLPGTKFCTPDWSLVGDVAETKVAEPTKAATSTVAKATTSTTSSSTLNETVQWTGVVTTGLNVRRWAGTEYGLCSFSPLKEGTEVGVCDTVKATTGDDWYFIKYQDKFGFASAKYIRKKEAAPADTTPKINADTLIQALTKMNGQMQKDLANGKKWGYYNSKVSSTFAEAVANGNRRCNCATLPNWALKMIGVMAADDASFYGKKGGDIAWKKSATKAAVEKYCDVIRVGNKTVNKAMADGTLKKGDIVTYVSMNHTNVYLGGERWFDSGHAYAHGTGDGAWWETWFGETKYGSEKIGYIIRLKTSVSYRVQVGVYSVLANANNMLAKVKAKGYSAEIVKANNQYIVQVGGKLFPTMKEAQELVAKLDRAKFPTAIIEIKN